MAGYRLDRSLLDIGVDSRVCVSAKGSFDERVVPLHQHQRIRRPLGAVLHQAGLNELDGVDAYLLPRSRAFDEADIIHCHALQGSWFSYPAVRVTHSDKPVVITLHDIWPFTRHCSFSFGCDRWRRGCGRCPHLDTYPAAPRDATPLEWRLKRWTWSGRHSAVVAPSEWMAGMARQSILGRCRLRSSPMGSTSRSTPLALKSRVARPLALISHPLVMMFAAASVDDTRKGADLVIDVIRRLSMRTRADSTVMLMGGSDDTMSRIVRSPGLHVVELGYVISDQIKASIYSAADVFVFPTRADNATSCRSGVQDS